MRIYDSVCRIQGCGFEKCDAGCGSQVLGFHGVVVSVAKLHVKGIEG